MLHYILRKKLPIHSKPSFCSQAKRNRCRRPYCRGALVSSVKPSSANTPRNRMLSSHLSPKISNGCTRVAHALYTGVKSSKCPAARLLSSNSDELGLFPGSTAAPTVCTAPFSSACTPEAAACTPANAFSGASPCKEDCSCDSCFAAPPCTSESYTSPGQVSAHPHYRKSLCSSKPTRPFHEAL
uniref:Uncharacterized protein n=1 Tax=Dunaliella tertiolecta TaxID=3047 RepID=A0A7S3QYV9_DUNTE